MGKIKYAIYQGAIGLYSMEYFDTPESVKGYPYVKESSLPIVMNSVGGYHTFYDDEERFIKLIEINEDEQPLTIEERYPKNSKDFEYGWIDLDGNTYKTGVEGHRRAADAICEEISSSIYNGENHLEELGWIKTTRSKFSDNKFSIYVKDCKITKKQSEALFDLGLYDNEIVQMLVSRSEEGW